MSHRRHAQGARELRVAPEHRPSAAGTSPSTCSGDLGQLAPAS
ncbi:MAG: hypothetical protein R3B70_15065 [Polyangiaceae bacterium]